MAHISAAQILRCFSRKPLFEYDLQFYKRCFHCCTARASSAQAPTSSNTNTQLKKTSVKSVKIEKINKAMQAYLNRAREHDSKMQEEIADYEIGRRHLANIMGQDPDNFGQEDIDRAIEYLLPSGLFSKKARPLMKHPLEIIPKKKVPQFGLDGRPHHFLYYTTKPNYYEIMYQAAWKLEELKKVEDHVYQTASGDVTNKENKMDLRGSDWISYKDIKALLGEKLSEQDYGRFVLILQRIADHPLSKLEQKFVMQYRKQLMPTSVLSSVPKSLVDENGREYQIGEGKRKTSKAEVKVWYNGTGQVNINGEDITYFTDRIHREQLLFPLQVVNKVGEVDIEAKVEGGGPTGQSGAIRLALSRALLSFLDKDRQEKMRIAGLLTTDPRKRERKKTGQEGARRKFTWKKR